MHQHAAKIRAIVKELEEHIHITIDDALPESIKAQPINTGPGRGLRVDFEREVKRQLAVHLLGGR